MTAANGHHPHPLPDHVEVAIVGSGFSGLGMAIKLREEGVEDFLVCERDAEVGGTWWANTYPGCQCDIPSHLYSFSFAPNPDWTRTYPLQPELRDYLRRCADDFGIRDRVRTGCEVTRAEWDEERTCWRLETTLGDFTAGVLVAAPGGLSEPAIPDIPGRASFEGTVFHTARWNHDHDLRGRRVAVVGTGASAIQVVPEIQPAVEHLDVYQRTPPWVVPHRDRPITAAERRLYRRLPAAQRLVRAYVYGVRELLVLGLAYRPGLMKAVERVAREHLERQVPDPALRAKLTPDYTIGCKRILPSNRWYPALTQPNVDVVTDGIREIAPNGIVDATGTLREVDTIVFATGFRVTDMPVAARVHGADGRSLSEVWDGSPQAYRGSTVAGFPNMFFLLGPNMGLGHNSMVFMLEAQLSYVLDALRTMRRGGIARVEVRPEAQRAYNERIQARLRRTVWNTGGCSSWYLDRNGRNSTLWPDFTWRFWAQMRRFDAGAYELARPVTRMPEPVPATA